MAARTFALFGICLFAITTSISGKGRPLPQPKQLFAHSAEWNVCFSFIQNGTNAGVFGFPTRAECERTVVMMDGGCIGPVEFVPLRSRFRTPLFRDSDCSEVLCPQTHFCKKGITLTCCNREFEKMIKDAESSKCPDGSKAAGLGRGKDFKVTFAKSCEDIICGKKQSCQQINAHFAKCCHTK